MKQKNLSFVAILSLLLFATNLLISEVQNEELLQAYNNLKKAGEYEKKKKALEVFTKNYNNEKVISMLVDLLMYNYDNPDFKENDQVAFYDDVIAEEIIKILTKSGHPSAFPALLRYVLYNKRHRDATVNAAWKAIKNIDWNLK